MSSMKLSMNIASNVTSLRIWLSAVVDFEQLLISFKRKLMNITLKIRGAKRLI